MGLESIESELKEKEYQLSKLKKKIRHNYSDGFVIQGLNSYSGDFVSRLTDNMKELSNYHELEILDKTVTPKELHGIVEFDIDMNKYPIATRKNELTFYVDAVIYLALTSDGKGYIGFGNVKFGREADIKNEVAFGTFINEEYGQDEINLKEHGGMSAVVKKYYQTLKEKGITEKVLREEDMESRSSRTQEERQKEDEIFEKYQREERESINKLKLQRDKLESEIEELQDKKTRIEYIEKRTSNLELIDSNDKKGMERVLRISKNFKSKDKIQSRDMKDETYGYILSVNIGGNIPLYLHPNFIVNGKTGEVYYNKNVEGNNMRTAFINIIKGYKIKKREVKRLYYLKNVLKIYNQSRDLRRKIA